MEDVAFKLAAIEHQRIQPMTDVMRKANELIKPLRRGSSRHRVIGESFERGTAWMMTLARLDRPSDIQAIHAGARVLLEITVDMVLLHKDKTDESAKMLLVWEDSQRLAAAETYSRYVQRVQGRVADKGYVHLIDFAQKHGDRIRAKRLEVYKTTSHPDRWRNKGGLLDDIYVADRDRCACWTAKDSSLEEVYAERYAVLNWLAHGSGNTALRGQPDTNAENTIAIRDFLWCVELCLKVAACEFPSVFADEAVVELIKRMSRHLAALDAEMPKIELDEHGKLREVPKQR